MRYLSVCSGHIKVVGGLSMSDTLLEKDKDNDILEISQILEGYERMR